MEPPDMEDAEGHYQVPGGRFFCLVASPVTKDSVCGSADLQEDSCADEVCTCTDESMDSGVHEDLTGGSSEEGLETFKQVEEVLVAEGCRLPDAGTTKVVVAIDLGTAYSGYAFSFTDDPSSQIYVMSSYQGGDPGIINQKIPTTLLLTPKEEFHSFGFAARDYFHDLEPQEAKKWLYFDKFKMVLHNNEVMGRDSTVRAANGKVLPALTVLSHALRHLGTLALREVRHRQLALELSAHSVRWVLTVPALWQPPARQLLREAAVQAGICSADNPDGLLIALEPEVASIYCRKQNFENVYANTEDNSLEETAENGTHYMVVDCGGGTVDITVHELCSYRGTLRELHTAVGGPWGSLGVDAEFENLLVSIFGEDFMEQFKLKRPAAYVELMVSFEARKRVASSFRDTPFNIFPPFAFIEYYRKFKGKEVDHAFKKLGRKDITWSSQGMLRLQPELMKELFEPTICSILKCIQDVFDQSTASKIKYLFLVGGFAESEILQYEVKQAFGSRVQIIIPQETGISILKGAVMFGLDPRVIAVRRSKHTYGVGVLKPFKEKEHPKDKLVEKGGVIWCADVLDKFVEADQDICVGETVVRRYTPTKNSQEFAVIKIYCVESENAKFITDPGVKHCGTLKLDLAQTRTPCREIQICMVFGGTEVTASAIDVSSGNRVHVQVDFLTNN